MSLHFFLHLLCKTILKIQFTSATQSASLCSAMPDCSYRPALLILRTTHASQKVVDLVRVTSSDVARGGIEQLLNAFKFIAQPKPALFTQYTVLKTPFLSGLRSVYDS